MVALVGGQAGDRRACPRTRKVRGNAATPPRGTRRPLKPSRSTP